MGRRQYRVGNPSSERDFLGMDAFSLYVIDDEQLIRKGISSALEVEYRISAFEAAEPALAALEDEQPDVVLLDVGLPGMSGIDALREIKSRFPDVVVIMITAYEDVDTVVSAMKLGAYDYVVKPIHVDSLQVTIRNALEKISLRREVHLLQERFLTEHVPCFIGESRAIRNVMEFVTTVAQSPDTPVMIFGETGTGKELIASAIHYRSPNFEGPLVPVNCAAIPKDLVESELFGYEKGAFSGATAAGKKGLVEEAENGTLFLDEVGDLSSEAQAKFLRFLENGEFCRIGGTKVRRVKTRVISATNKELERMMKDGAFRKDLYFRLGVIKVRIPSLNERQEDIIPLAKHFLVMFSEKFGKDVQGLDSDAEKALVFHHYAGNVRELRNIIERTVLTTSADVLSENDLGLATSGGSSHAGMWKIRETLPEVTEEGVDLSLIQESVERNYIETALRMAGGNESQAARLLNMNHHTFRYRRKKLLEK